MARQPRRLPHNRRRKRRASSKSTAQASVTPTAPVQASPATAQPEITPWGRLDEEYAIIRSDLKRLLAVTLLIFVLLAVLTVVLR